jgi:hypothetical protein
LTDVPPQLPKLGRLMVPWKSGESGWTALMIPAPAGVPNRGDAPGSTPAML